MKVISKKKDHTLRRAFICLIFLLKIISSTTFTKISTITGGTCLNFYRNSLIPNTHKTAAACYISNPGVNIYDYDSQVTNNGYLGRTGTD